MASQQDSEDPLKKRRARNDPNNRDFKCPCGKSYLSYPALFTHVKQKHNGKAPGPLIKPKNQNVKRGRPRGNSVVLMRVTQNIDEDESISRQQTILEKLRPLLEGERIEHTPAFSESSEQNLNCNRIFTLFYRETQGLLEEARRIIQGFLWLVKTSIQDIHGNDYCARNDATEIISIANQLVDEKRVEYKGQFPIQKQLLIQLTSVFFEWLYRKKYTNHIIQQAMKQ